MTVTLSDGFETLTYSINIFIITPEPKSEAETSELEEEEIVIKPEEEV